MMAEAVNVERTGDFAAPVADQPMMNLTAHRIEESRRSTRPPPPTTAPPT